MLNFPATSSQTLSMKHRFGLRRFEKTLERVLGEGWQALEAEGLLPEVLAYGVISPEGMECVEPFVFTRSDAAMLLKQWGEESAPDPRCALVFPPGVHQGERLEELFRPVVEAYGRIEIDEQAALDNEARSIIEGAVIRVVKRLVAAGALGDRSAAEAPFLGYFGYELGSEELAGHLRELNPPEWVDEWIAKPAEPPRGCLVSLGKPAVDVSVDAMSVHPGSGLVVHTAWSGLVRLWNTSDLTKSFWSRTDLDHRVTAHSLSANGRELFLAWRDGTPQGFGVQVFMIATRKRRDLRLALANECWALAGAPHRPWIAAGTAAGGIQVWDTESDCLIREWPAHGAPIRALRYSRDGRILFSATREDGLKAWAADGPQELFSVAMDAESVTPTPDGRELVVLSCGIRSNELSQVVTIVDADRGMVLGRLELNPAKGSCEYDHLRHGAKCAAVSDDGTRLALGVGFGEGNAHVRLLDYATGKELERVNVGHDCVNGLSFFPGNARRLLFSGRHFRGAQLYDWTSPQ